MHDLFADGFAPSGNAGDRSSKVRDFCFDDAKVRIDAPHAILVVLDSTLTYVPRFDAQLTPDVLVSAQRLGDVWEIRGPGGAIKVLDGQCALPQVAGAIVTTAIEAAAATRNHTALRATVVESGGRALAMVGDDWESTTTLGAHLHGRGWRYVGGDHALFDRATHEVFPVQKSLYVNSSAVRQFPVGYRRALETSPWYVTPQGISFYAVDPRQTGDDQTWASSAVLAAILVVDGTMSDLASLESLDESAHVRERFARYGVDWSRVRAGNLRLGGVVKTCDMIEHWFEAVRS